MLLEYSPLVAVVKPLLSLAFSSCHSAPSLSLFVSLSALLVAFYTALSLLFSHPSILDSVSPSSLEVAGMRVNCTLQLLSRQRPCLLYLSFELSSLPYLSLCLFPRSLSVSLPCPLTAVSRPDFTTGSWYTCVRTLARGASSSVRGRKIIDLAADLAAIDDPSGAHLLRPLRGNRNSRASLCSTRGHRFTPLAHDPISNRDHDETGRNALSW